MKALSYNSETGGALIYILIAIALLGALTASFLDSSGQQARTQNAFALAGKLHGQAQLIKSAIQECIILYPDGDPTVNAATTTDNGYHKPFPVSPNSNHFDGSTLGKTVSPLVKDLRCPGNPGVDNNHTPIFDPASGRFLPPKPSILSNWLYYNKDFTLNGQAVDGVSIRIYTQNTDPYIGEAMEKLASKYSACEAEYIVGDGTNGCPNGFQCFRLWIKRVAPAC